MKIFIFGFGNSNSSTPIKVTTMRVFDSIDPIIDLLIEEFKEDKKQRNLYSNKSRFELFLSRWRNPPKLYVSELNNPDEKPKKISNKKWLEYIDDYSERHPDKIAKLRLNGDL